MNYDNTDKGVLFKNDEKKEDRHPDYKGRVNAGGKDYWLSAWIKKAKDGRTYMSLATNPIEPLKPTVKDYKAVKGGSDIPF